MWGKYDIAVSAKTFWLLQRIAAAKRNKQASYIEVPTTADKEAELILASHLANHYPKLVALYDQREKLNQEAESAANEPLP